MMNSKILGIAPHIENISEQKFDVKRSFFTLRGEKALYR